MWADNHRAFHKINKISDGTVAWTLVMLFFASFFPYSTSIVASDFSNSTAQVFYGIIIILVSLSNIGISHSLNKAGNQHQFDGLFDMSRQLVAIDLGIKLVGMILSLILFPPATMWSIFIASAMLIIWNSIQKKQFNI
ncbi:putative membrane protein [Lactobacillus colini]|uniref:Membrane protein n=1 Tax=Lactobacillus colini TaxID=1819254 RepID=A0ABS4MHT1_9LACO|nr:putative membrane protein [Lactobacillus colini]